MLDMGFIPDIERIVKLVPFTRQTLFFSATMPPEIQKLADAFLHNPIKIEVARPASSAATITQRLVATGAEDHDKRERLRELIRNTPDFKNAIIFCNRKREVATLYRSLIKHGFNAAALHGDLDQRARMAALESFRNGQVALLVASDVAARGLDIPAVSHVFNYDVPHHAEDYVHRIGRTGRAGRTGYAYTLIAPGDEKSLHAIEALTLQPVEWEGASVAEQGLEAPRRRGREDRGSRGESSDRGDRGGERSERGGRTRAGRAVPRGGRDRPLREAAPDTVTETLDEQPARAAPASRPARSRAEPRARAEAAPRPEPAPFVERERRGPAPARSNENRGPRSSGRFDPDDRPVVGLGDHVPAFLLRPVQAKPSD
jgi:superfamily II DNA/RNA helicase